MHDHTSVLRFIETKFNLGALTRRDANASNLLDCFDFRRAAFLEPPALAAPGLPATGSSCTPEIPPPPTQPLAAVAASAPISGLGTSERGARDLRDEREKADPDDQRVALLRQLAGTGN